MKIILSICFILFAWQSAMCCTSVYQPLPTMVWEQFADDAENELISEAGQEENQAVKTEPTEEDDEHEGAFIITINTIVHFKGMIQVDLFLNQCYSKQILQPPCINYSNSI